MAAIATQYPQSVHRQSAPTRSCSTAGYSSSRPSKQMDVYDRFYGHKDISELSESIITALFACPLDSTSSSVNGPPASSSRPTPRLAEFIAYALHRTRLPDIITFQALFLLRRLKNKFPAARGSSGHRLFISALMLASKSSCDDTYSNKSWTIVCQGLFTLREVNQMERELFGYLGFKVNVEIEELTVFQSLLLAGDVSAIVESRSLQSSPNPTSPSMDTDCETPISVQAQTKTNAIDSPMRPTSMYPRSVSYDRQQHPYQTAVAAPYSSQSTTDLSPSNASTSSGRGSISSASGYSMTPSPSSMSHSESASISSRTTPDTPPSELCSSPWTDADVKAAYSGEPAGTYDDHMEYYQHLKNQQQFYGQQQPNVYGSASAATTVRPRHPFR